MRVWASSVVGHLMGVPPITPAEVEWTGDPQARPAALGGPPETPTCNLLLGDDCHSSGLYGPVGSSQVKVGRRFW
jgi:hypothetical protein